MNTVRTLWKKLPRTVRSSLYILLSLAALAAIYTFLGAPASAETQFRRAERAHMVGPGEILGTVDLEAELGSYRKMLLAETEEGVILYCYDHPAYQDTELIYREKTGSVTLLCAPYPDGSREYQVNPRVPVVLFDRYPDAVRAELDLTLSTLYMGQPFEKTYCLSSPRENSGYFLFYIVTHSPQGLGLQGIALQRFAMISGYRDPDMTASATVRLYDAAGTLIAREDTQVRSIPEVAREQAEGSR